MQKLNGIVIVDRVGKSCCFGLYNKRPLSYLSSIMNLYVPFLYYDNFNYKKGITFFVLINLDKTINLIKIK